jgi:hypothetical protein
MVQRLLVCMFYFLHVYTEYTFEVQKEDHA